MPDTLEYRAGAKAFADGRGPDTNPWPKLGTSTGRRLEWFKGYYDAKYTRWLSQFDARRTQRGASRK